MVQQAVPRLLVVEDDPDTASLMLETIADHFGQPCAIHCDTLARALDQDPGRFDLVLTDMNLPDGTGMELLAQLRDRRADLPVVLVTGVNVIDTAAAAITRGAYDYVVKAGDYLLTIPLIIEKNLALWRVRQENQRLQAELEQTLDQVRVKNEQLEHAVAKLERMAATDPLTGLANRRAFGRALERCFADAQRRRQDVSCLMIDLDAFKLVNDTLGHIAGDHLLHTAGRVLEASCRRSDLAGRYGGDELVLLLPQTGEAVARDVAERIRNQFIHASHACLARHAPDDSGTPRPAVTMSMGLASLHVARPATAEHLVACADHALYRAKLDGKGCLVAYRQPMLNDHTTASDTSDRDLGAGV